MLFMSDGSLELLQKLIKKIIALPYLEIDGSFIQKRGLPFS
tara:strand:- start:7002 stop:7124 length:123 start_codon:yes stop_codon:yes gene_type:complete